MDHISRIFLFVIITAAVQPKQVQGAVRSSFLGALETAHKDASAGISDFLNGFVTGLSTAVQGGITGAGALFNGIGNAGKSTFSGVLSGYNSTTQGLVRGATTLIGNGNGSLPLENEKQN